MERERGLVESRIAYPPPWRSEPRAWPWGFDLTRGYTYIHVPHNTRSAVRSRTYITIRRESSRVVFPAWQCHSHDCPIFSQGWRGWVFERKRGWLLRVRWPAVALFVRTRTRSSSDAIEARVRALRDSRSHPGPARLCMLRLRNKSEKGFTLVTLPQMPRLGRLRSSSRLRGRGRGRERDKGWWNHVLHTPQRVGRSPAHGSR